MNKSNDAKSFASASPTSDLALAYPQAARSYAAMLRSEHRLRPIEVVKQGAGVFRIFDGMHHARAAKIIGRKTIEAVVICEE
jgi:hypothetical protein